MKPYLFPLQLDEVGSENFVEEEGAALQAFNAENSVISLTGSNPMHSKAMAHVSKQGNASDEELIFFRRFCLNEV